jgi:uncharacterized protein (UPF0332 family)
VTGEIQRYIDKAEHALKVAEGLLKAGHPSDAASKTYYAMFYAAQALLKSEGIEVTKHSAVESALGHHFAKPGRLDRKYHRMLIDARKTAESDLEDASFHLQQAIEKFLKGYLLSSGTGRL